MNADITYCTRDCANTNCIRNKVYIDATEEYVSYCNFEDCEEYKDE